MGMSIIRSTIKVKLWLKKAMNNQSKIRAGFILTFSIVGLSILTNKIQAQTGINTNNQPTIPIDDGARYLRGLEAKNSSAWDFAVGGDNQIQKQEDYQLSVYESELRIIEQDQPQWRNSGEGANYSILVDIDNFLEEERK